MKPGGKKCASIYFLSCVSVVLLCICLLPGCRKFGTEKQEKSQDGFISCDYAAEQDEYIANLRDLKTDDHTLVIYTSFSYSNEGVAELNRLLQTEGYDFRIQIRQIPDEYASDMAELADDLKEAGIQADIFGNYMGSLSDAAEKGYFLELTKSLDMESGKKLKEQLPDLYWELSEVHGKLYFIGALNAAKPGGWAVNKELMDKYGFSEEDLAKPLDDLEEIFRIVWEGEKDDPKYLIKKNGEMVIDFSTFAVVSENLIYSLPFSFADEMLPIGFWNDDISPDTENPILVNLFETERMRNLAETLNRYYQKGYLKECEEGLPGSRNFFMQPDYNGYSVQREDFLDTWTNRNGIVLKRIPYYSQDVSDLHITGNAILNSSARQEDAFAFLSFIMTDQEASNLLLYGKEGIDYEKTEYGMAVAGENILDQSYCKKTLGNPGISSPLEPYEDNHKRELMEKNLDLLIDNPLYRFQFDDSPVKKQADAVREIYSYVGPLKEMFMFEKKEEEAEGNWETYYDSYCQKLKAAGIDDVAEEMNRQLEKYQNLK